MIDKLFRVIFFVAKAVACLFAWPVILMGKISDYDPNNSEVIAIGLVFMQLAWIVLLIFLVIHFTIRIPG